MRETRSTGGVAVILCLQNSELRARRARIGCFVGAWLCLNAALAAAQQLPTPRSGQPPLTPTVIDQAAARVSTMGWAGPTGDSGAAWVPNTTPSFPPAPSTTGGSLTPPQAQSPTPNQSRTDSTVAGIRPLTNWSTPTNGQDLQSIPVRTSLGETPNELGPINPAESQQGPGWSGLPNPQLQGGNPGLRNPAGASGIGGNAANPWQSTQSQSPQFGAAGDWQSANSGQTTPGSNVGAGGNPGLPPLNPAGVGQSNPAFNNVSNPLLPLSGGESLATGDRLLATDQVNRQRAAATIANRQSQIASWDTGIALPEFSSGSELRQGRPVLPTKTADEETFVRDTPQFQTPPIPSSQTAGTTRETSGELSTDGDTTSGSRADKSMDQFSWWLMMCSVLVNAILFYFLYDSRAKYLDLADELQARFFRER